MDPVSVVIPCYNAAEFLADAVASVRVQTLVPAEVLVVDDASTDATVAVAERLGVTVVRQPANRGPSAARNRGLAVAASDTVAFLDADDAWLPWHLEVCAGALAAHPDAALACTEAVAWDMPPLARPAHLVVEVPEDPTVTLLHDPFIPQAAAVVRRPVIQQLGGYNEGMRHAEDFDLWLRLTERHQVARVRAPGLRRRAHPGQATHALQRMVENSFGVRLRTLDALQAGGDSARAERAAAAVAAALDADLHTAWYLRDPGAFEFLLGLADRIPGADPVRRRWALRRRFGWHLWHGLRSVKRRLVTA